MSYIRELDVRGIDDLINTVKNVEQSYIDETESAAAAGGIFLWLGILGGAAIAPFIAAASGLAVVWGFYASNKREIIDKFIDQLEAYKDTLQNNPSIDLIRIEIYVSTRRIEGGSYQYPSSARVIGFRTNGIWSTID